MPGGTFFFTLVTYARRPVFRAEDARRMLRESFDRVRRNRPFTIEAMVLLPEHLHCIWTLPDGDAEFSVRWRKIKESFTRSFLATGGRESLVTPGQSRKGQRGVWQQRFWEHTIRDEEDRRRHVDYIHYNPVKHEQVACPHLWPWSTFARWVREGFYAADWCCQCEGRRVKAPLFDGVDETAPE